MPSSLWHGIRGISELYSSRDDYSLKRYKAGWGKGDGLIDGKGLTKKRASRTKVARNSWQTFALMMPPVVASKDSQVRLYRYRKLSPLLVTRAAESR